MIYCPQRDWISSTKASWRPVPGGVHQGFRHWGQDHLNDHFINDLDDVDRDPGSSWYYPGKGQGPMATN